MAGSGTTYYARGLSGEVLTEWRVSSGSESPRDYIYAGTRLVAAVKRAAATTVSEMTIVPNGPAPKPLARGVAGRLTQQGLEHIVLRPWATSGAKEAGKFATGTTLKSLKGMISQTLEQGAARANTRGRPGQLVEYDFGRQIGVNESGQVSTRLRVVLFPDGTVKTAFPY